jgi:NADH-quinone oxidoreductase subunit D
MDPSTLIGRSGPSFVNLQVLPELLRGHKIGDVIAILGSIDIVLGDVDR